MQYHPTPEHIVSIIKNHIPKNYNSFLDPSVGEGALLYALGKKIDNKKLTLIDIDIAKINKVRINYPNSELINSDFIDWRAENENRNYDLIIANPPFLAKSKELIDFRGRKVPIELAFIKLCVESLSDCGKLIAIVPSSLINSQIGLSLRVDLLKSGFLNYIYELPVNTFSRIEATFYIIVYDKNTKNTKNTVVRSLNFFNEDLSINTSNTNNHRFDYSFIKSKGFYDNLMKEFYRRNFIEYNLNQINSIKRGIIKHSYNDDRNIHSTALRNDIGLIQENYNQEYNFNNSSICLKRVSRKSNYSFSLIENSLIPNCTDCLFIISIKNIDILKAIFSLRVLYSNISGESLLLKGSGAQYISIKDLREIRFVDLSLAYRDYFLEYKKCLLNHDYLNCTQIENEIFFNLLSKYNPSIVEET